MSSSSNSSSSSSKTKSAAVQKAAQAAQAAQARVNQAAKPKSGRSALEDLPMYFLNLDPSTACVEVDKKDKKKLNVRFNIGGSGRSSGNQSSNTTKPYLCQQLVAASSKCSGEGNVGTKHKGGEFYRADATYGLSFRVGLTASGAGGEELLELQRASHKWVFDVACVLMGKVYDLKLEHWKGPVSAARNEACMALWRDIKDEHGQPLGSDVDLQALIETSTPTGKAAAKRVEAAARDVFVKTAIKKGNIPCAPIYDEKDKKTIVGYTDLYTHGRVYKFTAWSENHVHRKATGPLITELPSTLENWAEIQRQMGDVGREYSYAYELYDGADEKAYDMVDILMETINPATGQRVMQTKRIRNPYSNPLLETKRGVKLDTLVLPQIIFGIKRGLTDTEYGIKVRYDRKLRMTVQEKRPIDLPEFTPAYATSFVEDDEDEEQPPQPQQQQPAAAVPAPPVQEAAEPEDGEVSFAEVPAGQPFVAADEDNQPVDDDAQETEDMEEQTVPDAGDDDDAERLAAEEAERLAAEEAERLAAAAAAKTKAAPKRKGPPAAAATAATASDEKRARK
jgi:hypothetical protein